MDAGFRKRIPDQLMLEVIEVLLFTEQAEEADFPGTAKKTADVVDGLDVRVMAGHQLQGEEVVGIDEKGQLLLAVPDGVGGQRHAAEF